MDPFRIEFPDEDLLDLRERLRRTRWPEEEPDRSQGVPLSYLRDLCGYWASDYSWRATEARLNALPHFRTSIDGLGIHFVHARSPHPSALPLVLTHGWPGSFLEFERLIPALTDPPDPADAFHVVSPSLPGYGFSDRPAETGWGIRRIARAWATLMADLGYPRYGAAGSDWGTSVTTILGQEFPSRLAGIHVVPPLVAPDLSVDLTETERASLDALRHAEAHESGYSAQMSTKPQTVGYALNDSPAGLCAWIVEKFLSWSDTELTRDQMLDGITLYWLTGTATSSARLYRESFAEVGAWFTESTVDTVAVPTGCSIFPAEMPRPSRRWAERRFTDIRHWGELPRGGHFAAWEQPELFTSELRTFFRKVR
jgi:pimeloyl-ACP methyl ester carboxylesterase